MSFLESRPIEYESLLRENCGRMMLKVVRRPQMWLEMGGEVMNLEGVWGKRGGEEGWRGLGVGWVGWEEEEGRGKDDGRGLERGGEVGLEGKEGD